MENLHHIFNQMSGKKAVVIGDLYVDEYVHGTMESISQEGPIPVVRMQERKLHPAAAGHVAMLLQELGLTTACISVVGDDTNGKSVKELLTEKNINIDGVITDPKFQTRSHTRISVSGKHYPRHEVLRIDTPKPIPVSGAVRSQLIRIAETQLQGADVLVVVDRDHNIIDETLIREIRRLTTENETLLVGDSEKQLGLFSDFNAITPNITEAAQYLNLHDAQNEQIETIGRKLIEKISCGTIFISRGAKGIAVFESGGSVSYHPTQVQSIFDVTGAGETVVAGVAAGLASGATPDEAATLANLAASVAVTKPGMAIVSKDEILTAWHKQQAQSVMSKLVSQEDLKQIVQKSQNANKRVVWTNGCFDLMHVGHILYLEKAQSLGDILVVGLNSDVSVRKYKGPKRPIVEEQQRARILTALTCVDYVTIFDDETPMKLLEMLKPDIYAKGGDYTIDTINQDERRLVESYGGEIALLPGQEGMSTTQLIERIVTANDAR